MGPLLNVRHTKDMANLATLLVSAVLIGSSVTIGVGAIFGYASVFQGSEFPTALAWATPLAALTGALLALMASRKLATLLGTLFLAPLALISLFAMYLGAIILFNAVSDNNWATALGYGMALLGGGFVLNRLIGLTAQAFGLRNA